ncbi:MAG: LytTR family transcriptional regulator [Bacteroidales bacterium]|nr:LytTR family transcriptional regulator [Bacteroidales bacterium]
MEQYLNPKSNNFIIDQLQMYFAISLGLFLFVLFFQPFGLIREDVNENLLFIAGLGGIVFLFSWLFRIFIPGFFPAFRKVKILNTGSEVIIYALIWIFSSVAWVFYIRYVGPLQMTMFLVFKMVLVCLLPIVVLRIKDEHHALNEFIQALIEKNSRLVSSIPNEKPTAVETFTSDNKSDILKLQVNDLILVKSANNYVEILYRDKDVVHQKLLRNTLKNIENQLCKYPEFIRCHRTYIVNKQYVQDFSKGYSGYHIKMNDCKEEIPVSRQYLLSVKEAITTD